MSSSWQFIAIYCESLCRCFNLKSLDVNRGMQRQFVFCQWQKGFISSVFLLFFSFANKISLLPSCISFLVIVLSSFSTTMFLILFFSLCWPLLLPKLICSTSSLSPVTWSHSSSRFDQKEDSSLSHFLPLFLSLSCKPLIVFLIPNKSLLNGDKSSSLHPFPLEDKCPGKEGKSCIDTLGSLTELMVKKNATLNINEKDNLIKSTRKREGEIERKG